MTVTLLYIIYVGYMVGVLFGQMTSVDPIDGAAELQGKTKDTIPLFCSRFPLSLQKL